MAAVSNKNSRCNKCDKNIEIYTCSGCGSSFCSKHIGEHRQELRKDVTNIDRENDALKRELTQRSDDRTLLDQIAQWEKESVAKIRSIAEKARADFRQLTKESKDRLMDMIDKLSQELHVSSENKNVTENSIRQWLKQLEELKKQVKTPDEIQLLKDDFKPVCLVTIRTSEKMEEKQTDLTVQTAVSPRDRPNKTIPSKVSSSDGCAIAKEPEPSAKTNASPSQSILYPSLTFGLNQSTRQDIKGLFEQLRSLNPMDKNGPMNGKCDLQTSQMEQFLKQNFGFENIPDTYIVQGVKSFQIDRHPRHMDGKTTFYFPSRSADSFAMTVQEIIDWQSSYKVYTVKQYRGMTKEFLHRALQGGSGDGEEAFLMKFVVRISTCPVLMEFDAKIISRKVTEDWPHRIKLVSVTGIDFAGRKHDVMDILEYVLNWKDIYEIDTKTGLPFVYNGRDFRVKRRAPPVKLHEELLFKHLMYMARLRLQACDAEGVQIVVETGIGLGVFSGKYIGIDGKVRLTSALAIRTVLEEDGPKYRNIRAIVFALPILDENDDNGRIRHCFSDFVEQFQEPQYNGPIPVLIADQDMHRLTVAIARHGFFVSQLNPADSHGVFGEYWQNRGPAVEEKLALTTLGLLVQHHLINPRVLDPKNYYLI